MPLYPGISGASGIANHVHRRPDKHGRRWDQRRLVISSSHRLPASDVAFFKRSMIHALSPATKGMLGQLCERQCLISQDHRDELCELEDDNARRPCL